MIYLNRITIIFILVFFTQEYVFSAKLYNYKKKDVEFVEDQFVNEKILTVTHSFLKGDLVTLLDDNGDILEITPENAGKAIRVGFRYVDNKILYKYNEMKDPEKRKLFILKNKYKYNSTPKWIYTKLEPDLLTLIDRSYISLLASKVIVNHQHENDLNIKHFIRLILNGNGSIYIDWMPNHVPVKLCENGNGNIRLSYRVDRSSIVKSIKPGFSIKKESITFLPKDKIIYDNLWRSNEFVVKLECWAKIYVLKPQIGTRYNNNASQIFQSAQRMACHISRPEPYISPECYNEQLKNVSWDITALFNTTDISSAVQNYLIENKPSEFPLPDSFIKLSGDLY